jgi:site-specific DNA recombinase
MKSAGYVRVSTARQASEGLSLAEQERAVRERAEREGWTLADIYVERGVSGKRDDRQQLLKLFAELDGIDRLIIPRLDRLGRRTVTLQENFERLEKAGVGLVCLKPEFDSSTATGRMVRDILAALASYESEVTGERVDAVMGSRIEKGKHHGRAPFGYMKVDKQLVPDPDAAPIVQRIFRELAEGVSTTDLAQKLNAEKVPQPNKSIWRRSFLTKITDNVTYIGHNKYAETVAKGEHDAIIDDELWGKVRALREAHQASTSKGRGRRPKRHLFARGMLRCGTCGGSMSPSTAGNGYETYRCITRAEGADCSMPNIPRKLVDKAVFGYFENVGIDVEATRKQLEGAADTKLEETAARLRAAKKAEKDAGAAVKRVQADYTSGAITAADWKALRGDLEACEADATAHRKQIEAEVVGIEQAREKIDGTKATAEKLAAIRAAVAGEADGGADLDAVRASLNRAFEGFWIEPARVLSDAERKIMQAQAAEYGDEDAIEDIGELTAGTWTIQPIPRLEVVELIEAIDAESEPVVEIRPVLKAEAIGKAPVSVVAERVQFLDGPSEGRAQGASSELDGGNEDAERELAGVGAEDPEVTF